MGLRPSSSKPHASSMLEIKIDRARDKRQQWHTRSKCEMALPKCSNLCSRLLGPAASKPPIRLTGLMLSGVLVSGKSTLHLRPAVSTQKVTHEGHSLHSMASSGWASLAQAVVSGLLCLEAHWIGRASPGLVLLGTFTYTRLSLKLITNCAASFSTFLTEHDLTVWLMEDASRAESTRHA